jgi:hypothetical protein
MQSVTDSLRKKKISLNKNQKEATDILKQFCDLLHPTAISTQLFYVFCVSSISKSSGTNDISNLQNHPVYPIMPHVQTMLTSNSTWMCLTIISSDDPAACTSLIWFFLANHKYRWYFYKKNE